MCVWLDYLWSLINLILDSLMLLALSQSSSSNIYILNIKLRFFFEYVCFFVCFCFYLARRVSIICIHIFSLTLFFSLKSKNWDLHPHTCIHTCKILSLSLSIFTFLKWLSEFALCLCVCECVWCVVLCVRFSSSPRVLHYTRQPCRLSSLNRTFLLKWSLKKNNLLNLKLIPMLFLIFSLKNQNLIMLTY